jgi:uncharacterized protein (DUF952 family)
MANILHITHPEDWRKAMEQGSYTADSLASEGFIHCSTPAQIAATANRYYAGQHDLILLVIDSGRVQAEIRWENLVGGEELYPHIYGQLNLDAVTKAVEIEPDEDGYFSTFAY